MSALNTARRDSSADRTSLQTLDGDVQVLCTFDYQPAEAPNYNADSMNPGPGCDAAVTVTSVAINGHEVDVSVFHPKVIAHWENEILTEVAEDESDARYAAEEARAEWARECARTAA